MDRLLEGDVLTWSLVNQNREKLGLSEDDVTSIKPLFKTGCRDSVTTNWKIEACPDTFMKLKNKVAYPGFSKFRIKLYSHTPQCFNCQRYGHTAARYRAKEPTCRNYSGAHDSRSCDSELVKFSNCKNKGHKAFSANCLAKLTAMAIRTILRRTDFGTVPLQNV